jgi:hypothetical protein
VPGYWAAKWFSAENPVMSKAYIASKRATMSPEMFKQEYEADIRHVSGCNLRRRRSVEGCVIDDGDTRTDMTSSKAILP